MFPRPVSIDTLSAPRPASCGANQFVKGVATLGTVMTLMCVAISDTPGCEGGTGSLTASVLVAAIDAFERMSTAGLVFDIAALFFAVCASVWLGSVDFASVFRWFSRPGASLTSSPWQRPRHDGVGGQVLRALLRTPLPHLSLPVMACTCVADVVASS